MTTVTGTAVIGGQRYDLTREITLPPPAVDARELVGLVVPWQTSDYRDIPGTFGRLVDLGVKVIRGRWLAGGKGDQVMSLCAEHDIKWIVTFAPESWTETGKAGTLASQLKQLETWMRAAFAHPDAESVVLAVENINEPEHVRGGGSPVSDWAVRCVAYSWLMRKIHTELGHSWLILSSALNDKLQDDTNGAGWKALAAARWSTSSGGEVVALYCDRISLHGYLKGDPLNHPRLDERIALADVINPGAPVWLTETGAVTEPARPGGPVVVTRARQAELYATIAQTVHDHARLELAVIFELLDASPATTDPEGNRGIVAADGTLKPAGVVMQGLWKLVA